AVFEAGCTFAAVEEVCGVDSKALIESVDLLVDHGLLVRDGVRLDMLETIREYALERLAASPDADRDCRRRHAEHFAALAESAEGEYRGPLQKAALDRIEAEHPNLRSALQWSLAHSEPLLALRLGA